MLRITREEAKGMTVTLRLEGRVVGPWVKELTQECARCLINGKRVVLDLAGVGFIGEEGIKALKALMAKQVQLSGCSLFISALLKRGGIQ